MKSLSILLSFVTVLSLSVWACGSAKIPRFERPVYSLDNTDPNDIKLRYKFDQSVVSAKSSSARGAVVFLPEDFEEFVSIYIAGCMKWDPSLELIDSSRVIQNSK